MIVFLHIPKTAGTSFRFVLENSFGISHCHAAHVRRQVFSQADFEFARKFFPRLRSIAGHNLVDPLRLSFPDPFFVTMLRDPVARVLSNYQGGVVQKKYCKSLEERLREKRGLENLHVKLMAGERNLDKAKRFLERCNVVGLTEKFDQSLHLMQKLSPYPLNLTYRRRRFAKDNSVKKAIENDPRLIDMIREYNRLDLELYSFAEKEIFPALCQKAQISISDPVLSSEVPPGGNYPKRVVGRIYNKIFREVCRLRPRQPAAESFFP